jgi:hypothetical protein
MYAGHVCNVRFMRPTSSRIVCVKSHSSDTKGKHVWEDAKKRSASLVEVIGAQLGPIGQELDRNARMDVESIQKLIEIWSRKSADYTRSQNGMDHPIEP